MNLIEPKRLQEIRVPRAGGDEPSTIAIPGAWDHVFPARAGMNRLGVWSCPRRPRAGGDEPPYAHDD